jgi:hypothetical protein
MSVSPVTIERVMSDAQQAIAALPDTSDQELLLATIEGESDALEAIDRLAEMALADKHLVEIARARAQRLEARAAGVRSVIIAMMQGLQLSKLQRPLATMSVSHSTTARVTDQAELPAEYMRSAPDMHAIRKALTNGETVPGASLNNPAPVLTIRTR